MTAKSQRKRKRGAKRPHAASQSNARWSGRVTRESRALDLEPGVFTLSSPRNIAKSLKRSAERSKRRKSSPYRSALSMLIFYINRAGRNLPARQKNILEDAQFELKRLFRKG
jgi:hypothetical protein